MNKCDLLAPAQSAALRQELAAQFPQAQILEVSARHGAGLEDWFAQITSASQIPRDVMDVDYTLYAEGEALLGWLNCTLQVRAGTPLDGNELVKALASEIQRRLNQAGTEVAHLKMTLDADNELGDLAVVNLVRNDLVPELSQNLQDKFVSGELTINMRAETAPELMRDTVRSAVETCAQAYPGLTTTWQHLECFRPGKPQPTHRVTQASWIPATERPSH